MRIITRPIERWPGQLLDDDQREHSRRRPGPRRPRPTPPLPRPDRPGEPRVTKKGSKAHRCPCCGRRTYRRPRILTGDYRCTICAQRGHRPQRAAS